MPSHSPSPDPIRRHSSEELKRIEKDLFDTVIDARERYAAEVKKYKDLVALVKDLGLQHPDGNHSMKTAIQVQKDSLHRYSQAVRVFNDFVLYKKIPPEHSKAEDEK